MNGARRGRVGSAAAGAVTGVVIAGVVALMGLINVQQGAPWAPGHTLTAQVSDADGIVASSDVRIAGRVVGQVTGVQAEGDHAAISMSVDAADWPLPADSRAGVRLGTLLGQKYVELVPGHDHSALLADGGVIPLQSTSSAIDFDQLLDTFDAPTREHLTSLIRTASAAVDGQQQTLQSLIPALRDISQASSAPLADLAARNPQVDGILADLGTTADQLNLSRNDLASVVDSLNAVTGALARAPAALQGAIQHTDELAQTAGSVLSGGGAQQLNSGLQQAGTLAGYASTLLSRLVPQTSSFKSNAAGAAQNVVLEIADAISQSDGSGFFLRQNLDGVDLSGLVDLGLLPGGSQLKGVAAVPPSISLPLLPTLPAPSLPLPSLPPLPRLPLPSLPPLNLPLIPSLNLPLAYSPGGSPSEAWPW